MKTRSKLSAATLALALLAPAALSSSVAPTAHASAAAQQQQAPYGPLERGYRTGYSDGYQAGWSDSLKGATADYRGKADYQRADRAYVAAYGSLEDYRDGYQQGFEVGYQQGFAHQGFNSEVPAGGLTRRGASVAGNGASGGRAADAGDEQESVSTSRRDAGTAPATDTDAQAGTSAPSLRAIPANTMMKVELLNRLSTDISQQGDRFEARVVEPREFEGATVGGRISNLQRPGKARGRALLQLNFDQIRLSGGEWQDFSAQVVEVLDRGGSNVGDVDPEGGVRGKDSTKDDVAKVGASAGVGAIIGAIGSGGKGAAIGAIIGGAAGGAGVMTQRGKDIRLERGQQLRIRTTGR